MFPVSDNQLRRAFPVVVILLIMINAWVFYREFLLSTSEIEAFFSANGMIPLRDFSTHWQPWPFVSSLFLHGGFIHLLVNMWSFWIFGDNVESEMGPVRFLIFYLACGVLASVLHAALYPLSTVPVVGASGAIAGVMGAYMMLFPRAKIRMFTLLVFYPIFFEIPAWVFLLLWFFGQVVSGAATLDQTQAALRDAGGIAFFAHVGGFVAGIVLLPFFRRS